MGTCQNNMNSYAVISSKDLCFIFFTSGDFNIGFEAVCVHMLMYTHAQSHVDTERNKGKKPLAKLESSEKSGKVFCWRIYHFTFSPGT